MSNSADVLGSLDGLKDEELQEVIKRAQEILAKRVKERRQSALTEIQKLAKEHGIKIDLGEKKRGRPSKAKPG